MKRFVSTAIDYPNSPPHIGTAFEKIGADVQARYWRMTGADVLFQGGMDENTYRVFQRAQELGEDPKEYCDRMASQFKSVWHMLDISYDRFVQTTEERHVKGVKEFITKVWLNGYIYKKKYVGSYCTGCDAFKTEKDLVEGRCPSHKGLELRRVEEENWFFRLSQFRDYLRGMLIDRDGGVSKPSLLVEPISRRNEMLAILDGEGLEDISISRKNLGWGIPVPWDETQVIYVWFDALLNYMTGCGLFESERLIAVDRYDPVSWWPADVHFVGKDIVRFHTLLWPAMIKAYADGGAGGLKFLGGLHWQPKRVYGHGFIKTRSGEKVSKSGAFIDPVEIVGRFGCDAYRYYFLAKCDYGQDGEYDPDHFVEVYNADLANNLGNLVSRVIAMTIKYFGGKIPAPATDGVSLKFDDLPVAVGLYPRMIEDCQYKQVLEGVWDILRDMNAYIDEKAPWKLYKTSPQDAATVLGSLIHRLRLVAFLLKPFLPSTGRKIWESFRFEKSWDDLKVDDLKELAYVPTGKLQYDLVVSQAIIDLGRPVPLFQRYEDSHPHKPASDQVKP